jgi:hypothetical protein
MSMQINLFMKSQLEDEPEIKKEYLAKLEKIRRGPFIKFEDSILAKYKRLPSNNKSRG